MNGTLRDPAFSSEVPAVHNMGWGWGVLLFLQAPGPLSQKNSTSSIQIFWGSG